MRTIAKAKPERELARERGDEFYFTGRPCKHGHNAKRRTKDAICQECAALRVQANKEYYRDYMRQKRSAMSPEEREAARVEWAQRQREGRVKDPEKFRARERIHGRLKRQRYPERKLAETRARQAARMQRTPPWADLKVIREFYENCPLGHEVDHVVPLRAKLASGLHVIDNLQYLTKEENRLKGNRFDPEAWAA